MIVEIRALRTDDDRAAFRSGDEALDLFFHRYAGQNQFRHHIGVTYVAVGQSDRRSAVAITTVSEARILGFFTVSPATLDADHVPSKRRLPPYPVPVLRVARLATDEHARGVGIGGALLRHCIELAEKMRDEVGCVGLLVDAKPGAPGFYERLGFVPVSAVEGNVRTVPAAQLMFLALGSVPAPR
jgi:GNAT superfamily N-acetyltransferase